MRRHNSALEYFAYKNLTAIEDLLYSRVVNVQSMRLVRVPNDIPNRNLAANMTRMKDRKSTRLNSSHLA